jgi:tRNA G10  N-methylase Trm11
MAPEIVFSRLAKLPAGSVVLDPMSGSGTVLRAAAELGHDCIGFDLDPLAVLMARVWTTPINTETLNQRAVELVETARSISAAQLPWIKECAETKEFVDYWFEEKQQTPLRRLARALSEQTGQYADALRIALSRIIVTKERGASIARDTSHSRPHRSFQDNDYDVFAGFLQAADRLGHRLVTDRLIGSVHVRRGDARRLHRVKDSSVDAVVTSPPYLNAIDYLRGHRLSLVWLGHTLSSLRPVRAGSIGTEISKNADAGAVKTLVKNAGALRNLPDRELGMVHRYAADIQVMMQEVARTLKPGGKAVLVVGNSRLKNVSISNAEINKAAAQQAGLRHRHTSERELPANSRYLPIPKKNAEKTLSFRMRTETVLSFTK